MWENMIIGVKVTMKKMKSCMGNVKYRYRSVEESNLVFTVFYYTNQY